MDQIELGSELGRVRRWPIARQSELVVFVSCRLLESSETPSLVLHVAHSISDFLDDQLVRLDSLDALPLLLVLLCFFFFCLELDLRTPIRLLLLSIILVLLLLLYIKNLLLLHLGQHLVHLGALVFADQLHGAFFEVFNGQRQCLFLDLELELF